MSIQVTGHFLIRFGFVVVVIVCFCFSSLLDYMNSLYILAINPLSDTRFTNIFSCAVGCFFILLIVSFAVQKFLICCSLTCLFLLLLPVLLRSYPKKSLPRPMSSSFSLVFF